jgi:hypothetical protein
LGYLARIEELLRQQADDPELVLSDYFDLIGGTSTGAIIASVLALGWPVHEIQHMYATLGRTAFTPKRSWFGPAGRVLGAKFDDKPLATILKQHLGDIRLGSGELRTGLMVVAKRADTASVWVFVNTPQHKFYEMNRNVRLWEIVRASTAAPTYFKPQFIADIGGGESGVFVDGGVSMHSNPALQLLMVANLDGFGLRWPLGAENVLLCSVGTGAYTATAGKDALQKYSNLHWLGLLAVQLMKDTSELNQTILEWMSDSPTAKVLDRQIEDLRKDQLGPTPLITYLRYDIELEREALGAIGLEYSAKQVASLRKLGNVENIAELERVGVCAAAVEVEESHFPQRFDRKS